MDSLGGKRSSTFPLDVLTALASLQAVPPYGLPSVFFRAAFPSHLVPDIRIPFTPFSLFLHASLPLMNPLSLLILLGGCLASVFMAGGPRQGGEGAFLLTTGMVLIFFRPMRPTSWWLWLGGLLVLLTCSASLLPADVLPIPAWKQALVALPSITIPPTITCDPYAVAFWLSVLGVSIATALFVLGQPLQGGALRFIALAAVVGCTAYAVTAMAAWSWGWHYPFFHQDPRFPAAYGFFTNRNQTAGFLLTGAILSLGMIRRGFIGKRWLYVLAGVAAFTVLCYCLLFLSASRGGLVFLIVGCAIWLAGLGGYRSRGLLAASVVLAIIIGISFVRSDNGLVERLIGGAQKTSAATSVNGDEPHGPSDSRLPIWRDTLGMIGEQPLVGSGLGSYAYSYPFHAKQSFSQATALHAESSWLTLAAEAGIPALLAVLGCLAFLIAGIPLLERLSGRDWPLRWGFLAAFFAELLHALVDVPLHKPELGWWLLLLGGIGFAPLAETAIPDRLKIGSWLQRIVLILAGLGSFLLGGWMLAAQFGKAPALPPFAAVESEKHIETLYRDVTDFSPEEVSLVIRGEMARQPMNPRLHFLLGRMLLMTPGGLEDAKAEFRAEQALSPKDPMFSLAEGSEIAPYDTEAALAFWKEAIRRRLLIDEAIHWSVVDAVFGKMIADSNEHPELAGRLNEIAEASPLLRYQMLVLKDRDPALIGAAVSDDVFMQGIREKDRARLFDLWYKRGNRATLAAWLETHHQYERETLPVRAQLLSEGADPRQGYDLLVKAFSLSMPEAQGDSVIRSTDGAIPSDPAKAAAYYLRNGNIVTAHRLLSLPEVLGNAEGQRLRAALDAREGRWRDAVQHLISYLHQSKKL
jgi:O-antigen ligase